MAKKRFWVGILYIALASCLILAGCPKDPEDDSSSGTSGTPQTPSNLRVTSNTGGVVKIGWSSVTNASKYTVEFVKSGDSTKWLDDYYSFTSATLSNLEQGATYTIYVYAWSSDERNKSAPATTTVTVSRSASSPTSLLPPIGLKIVSNTGGTVGLQWAAVTNATGYIVEYKLSTSDSSGWIRKDAYNTSVLSYSDFNKYLSDNSLLRKELA